MQRYFSDDNLKLNESYNNLEEDAHHILSVMRMSFDDKFQIVDRDKNLFIAKITDINPLTYTVVEQLDTNENLTRSTVICPLLKGEKFDFMLQKATELGAHQFLIYEADHAVVKLDQKKRKNRLARYEKIVKSASEQSKRLDIPTVNFVGKLDSIDFKQFDLNLFAYEDLSFKASRNLIDVLNQSKDATNISVVFGPEGGFSNREVKNDSFTYIKLGSRILRAETAPLYMLSVLDAFFASYEH